MEDLGKMFTTPKLQYQVDFENERRWLTWDLLCGRVGEHHPMRGYFRWAGINQCKIDWFLKNNCPPDIISVNYYVTSERFLDRRIRRYPQEMLRRLLKEGKSEHPVLKTAGWWREHSESFIQHNFKQLIEIPMTHSTENTENRPIIITGASGTLGRAFKNICDMRGLKTILTSRDDMDIADAKSVEEFFKNTNPWAVINAAGYVRVDDAESDERTCYRENTLGNIILADQCARRKIRFMTFSSDLVFDGKSEVPYTENISPNPQNIYGRSKFRAERCVMQILPEALIIRTSAFFGPWDNYNFLKAVLREISHGNLFFAADDAIVSPTYVPDLVNAALDAFLDEEKGILHLANGGETSWYDFAKRAAEMAGLETNLIIPRNTSEFDFKAERPLYTVLKSEKRALMPTLEDAMQRFIHEWKQQNQQERKLILEVV